MLRSAAMAALLLGCGSGEAGKRPHRPSIEPLPPDLVTLAEGRGFTVQPGEFAYSTFENCCEPGAHCLGNNPSTPYGTAILPPPPGGVLPERDALGAWGSDDDMPGLTRSFHLLPGEAVVWIGRTPPPSRYFSVRSYLTTRPRGGGFPPALVIGSLGPSLNQQVMAAQVGDEAVWDREMAVVMTAHAGVEADVRAALVEAGFDPAWIFVDRVPPDVAHLGDGEDADLLSLVFRVAVTEDVAASEAYLETPGATVLRLSRDGDLGAGHPRGALPERGSGTVETHLTEALDDLERAIDAAHPDGVRVFEEAAPAWFETYACIEEGLRCMGEIRDRYAANLVPMLLEPDSFAVVYGVNHDRAGKASYANFSVDTLEGRVGVAAVDSSEFVGSARTFLPDHPAVDDLYAWTIARDCGPHPGPCLEIPTTCPGAPLDSPVVLTVRAYLEPSTGAAPLAKELVLDRAVKFWAPE